MPWWFLRGLGFIYITTSNDFNEMQEFGVIHAVTRHAAAVANLAESVHDLVLVLGENLSKPVELDDNLLKTDGIGA